MFDKFDDILTIDDLAEALKIGTCKAYSLVKSGDIHAYKEGKDWKIPKVALIEYITKRINEPKQKPLINMIRVMKK